MAWGRKKDGGRKEPQFGLGASLAALRLSPQDRIPTGDDVKPKKSSPKPRPDEEEDDEPSPVRKVQASRSVSKGRSKSRSGIMLARLLYWGAVVGLWVVIAIVGAAVWAGAHLPPIQSLEIPKRPPTIEIVGVEAACWPSAARWPAPMSR